jgi:hypothetical protein
MPQKFTGRTGRNLKFRYDERVQDIIASKTISKFFPALIRNRTFTWSPKRHSTNVSYSGKGNIQIF